MSAHLLASTERDNGGEDRQIGIRFEPCSIETILATVEKNRDRVRSIGAMVLSLCGILISASDALILFMTDKRLGSHRLRLALGTSVLCFGVSVGRETLL